MSLTTSNVNLKVQVDHKPALAKEALSEFNFTIDSERILTLKLSERLQMWLRF